MFPLFWASLAFLAGVLFAKWVHLPLSLWLASALLALAVTLFMAHTHITFPRLRNPALLAACALSFGLGAARLEAAIPRVDISQLAWFNDRAYDLLVSGTLIEPADYRDQYTNLRLQVSEVDTGLNRFRVSGLLLARVPPNRVYHYGEMVRLRGRMQTPPENEEFSYRDYLAYQGVLSYMPVAEVTRLPGFGGNPLVAAMYALKERALERVYRLFPDPEASLLAGILLGVDSALPARLQQAFRNTGTAHIIAISGFNISILAGLFMTLFSRLLGWRRGAVLAVLGIAFYAFLVGADAAVVRAALMGTLSLLALQVGRRQQALNTLAFVAALMALANPFHLWDVGFQLSFLATLGLILYAEPFGRAAEHWLRRGAEVFKAQLETERILAPLSEYVLLTLAAQLTTLPIAAYHFKQISLISLIANPFILPAQPAVMVLGGLAVALSLLFFPLGQAMAWIAWPPTAYTIRMVELWNRSPAGVLYLEKFSFAWVALFYGVLMALTFGARRLRGLLQSLRAHFQYLSTTAVLAGLLSGTLLTWRLLAAVPDGRLHLTFLDVGSAEAVLIRTPGGRHILINGGPSTSSLSDALGRRLSPLDHRLDWLIIASPDEAQVASLPRLLDRYPPRKALWAGREQASFSARSVDAWLTDHGVPVVFAEEGQTLDLGLGATLRVVNVSSRGATLLVEWKPFRALLPIGANFETLEQLERGRALGPVEVLLLAQSGYAPLTPPDWIENLNPALAVLSVAAGDRNGLPDPETLEALDRHPLLRTDQNGWIEVITDGSQMWVNVERKAPPPEPGESTR